MIFSCFCEAWCWYLRWCFKCEREVFCEICGILCGDVEDVV